MDQWILGRVILLLLLVPSLSIHEWAHAASAYRLGDDTAAREGRLTLNPLAHIDLIGTILLPLLGVPFGWAKPVPVNPMRFGRGVSMRTGMMLTAAAGPASNIALAVVATIVLGLLFRFAPGLMGREGLLSTILFPLIQLNVTLAVFNLLPIPPLDGSRIVDRFIPRHLEDKWLQVRRYATFLLLAVIVFGSSIIMVPSGWLLELLLAMARIIAGV